MDNQTTGNITYFNVLNICYRIYGLYLIVTGFLDTLSYSIYLTSHESYIELLMMDKLEDLYTAVLTLISGIVILVLSRRFTARVANPQLELSLAAEQLQHIVFYAMYFVLTMTLVPLTINILAGIGILLYKSTEGIDLSEVTIIAMMLILWCILFIVRQTSRKLVRFIIR
ncbi:hypothetical protein [Paenibacillus sp. FSL R7-0331]|uniref:hypothetical protein n=1 Tax=Paenibacillus sp. FSL R7-0331 TaxID=1536773 RepID=UPI0004F60284|nr:hypothetical protein [Paenibacillus sp. FSL R7-0331]AIQ53741.1 hypothetical protein R70331_20880 [Paenibacillus sp. FSL R7-0331]